MKKLLVLNALALVTALVICITAAGCADRVDTYTDSGQEITIGTNQMFVIAIGSNPTTGYSWQESYDAAKIALVSKTFEPGQEAEAGMTGAGGIELFRFRTLEKGEAEITLTYQRPWEAESLDRKIFTVNVT